MDSRRHKQTQGSQRYSRRSRYIPLEGYGEDAGNFFRCWHCGFINDVRDNTQGGENATDATVLTRKQMPSDERPAGGRGMDVRFMTVSPEIDADGNPKAVKEVFTVEGGGCPLCHTRNPRGDY